MITSTQGHRVWMKTVENIRGNSRQLSVNFTKSDFLDAIMFQEFAYCSAIPSSNNESGPGLDVLCQKEMAGT